MENKVKIYKLIDPRNHEIRYVGKTIHSLNRRLIGHIDSARRFKNYLYNWINSLAALDLKPIIELIEEVDESVWEEKEIYWIQYHLDIGCDLTNYCKGGSLVIGLNGKIHPIKAKNLSKSQEERNNQPLTPKRTDLLTEFNIIKDMYLNGNSMRTIAKKYHCSMTPIIKILDYMNITRRNDRQSVKDADIIYVYKLRKKGLNYSQIAKIFKRDREAIKTALKKYSQQQGEINA